MPNQPTTDPTPVTRGPVPRCITSVWDAGAAHATVEREATGTTVSFLADRISVRLIDEDRGSLRLLLSDALAALDAVDSQGER